MKTPSLPHPIRLCRGLLVAALLVATFAPAAESKRPNIVFAFADDWGRHASAYAQLDGPGTISDVVHTPNFDRVAKEGVLFRSAFVSAPSCTPCRSSILSGQHFWRTGRGAILRGAIWDFSNASFALMLHDAGYHIGKSYKVWSPGTPVDAPYGGDKYNYEKAGTKYRQFSVVATALVAGGKSVEAAKQVLYDEVTNNFDDFLAARKSGEPFCYWFGPTMTHRKYAKGSGLKLWGIAPERLKGKLPPFLPDVPEVREDVADYLGEAQAFDTGLGLLLKKLKAIGELDNTLIVVSGDHGAPGFPHGKCNLYDFGVGVALAIRGAGTMPGRVVDDLISLPDLAPTFLELGGVKPLASMTGRSLVPILRSSATGQVEAGRTAVYSGRERHVEDARAGNLPYPQRAIRTHDFLYIINFKPDRWPIGEPYLLDGPNVPGARQLEEQSRLTFYDMDSSPTKAWLIVQRANPEWTWHYEMAFGRRPREELYDLKKDPHQVNNVAASTVYAKTRADLEARLMDELRRTGDPRVVEDGKFFESPPMAGPLPTGARKKGGENE